MSRRFLLAQASLVLLVCAGCSNPLQPRIDAANRQLTQTKDRFAKIRSEVEDDLKKEPDLFRAANVTAAWRDRFQTDQEKLNDAFADLEKLKHRDKNLTLFNDVDRLQEGALNDATSIKSEAFKWLDLKRNTATHLAHMKSDYQAIKSADDSKVEAALEKAENDWPAKKADLEGRIASLKEAPQKAEKTWADAQQAAAKPDYAALMNDEQWLDSRAGRPEKDLKLVSQLYDGKDVILEQLDAPRRDALTCQAKVKIIDTHFTDVENNKSTTDTKQKTEDYPLSKCDSLQNDLGMEIEHKPAGAYETEAQLVPQPPGFAYMAPPGQRNQYGYWEQRNGASVWTWLPEYLLLRELLWNHHYMPIPSYEYEGYWAARRTGTTYYGQTYAPGGQVQSAPKYGTHGTFTGNQYAGGRYQNRGGTYGSSPYASQGGGYRSSGYASGSSASGGSANGQSAGAAPSDEHGHQFGRTPSSSGSTGRRFGSSGGSSHRSAPSGRRYGRR